MRFDWKNNWYGDFKNNFQVENISGDEIGFIAEEIVKIIGMIIM